MASPGRRQTQTAAYGMQEQSNAGFDGPGLWRATPSPDVDTVLDKAIHDLAIYGIELLMNHHESSMMPRQYEFVLCLGCVQNRAIRPYRNQLPAGLLFPSPLHSPHSQTMNLAPLARAVQEMVALARVTTLRSGGVRVSVWARAAYVKTSGISAAHRRAPWTMGNKQRGLMRFRFHPSGIVARRSTDQSGSSKHERLNYTETGRGSSLGDCVSRRWSGGRDRGVMDG